MPTKKPLSFEGVHHFLRTLFADDLHAKRVLSLAGATLGVIESASLAVAMIGQGLALARGRLTKHTIKQVDRLLSNPGIDVDALLVHWVPYVVGSRSSITVAMDWTDFDADGQTTIMLSLLCRHGRATPLVWLTVDTATLKDRRNAYEDQVLMRLAAVLPADVRVRIVADRGFGDQKLYRMLTDELKFDFVIRVRGNIKVTAADGEARRRPSGSERGDAHACCAGDMGGIICGLDIGGPNTKTRHLVSITHLTFHRRVPLSREIEAYQRHRTKKLRQQQDRGY